MELETSRLLLRPFKETDLPHMQRYAVRREFYEFLPIPEQTPETVAQFLQHCLEQQSEPGNSRYIFAIEPKDNETIAGSIRIEIRDEGNKQGDVGYGLDRDHQGKGYMTEALAAILAFGFNDLALRRIWATADTQNERSWRLLERIGMVREGLMRQDTLIRGQWRDSYLYAILATEFSGS